jgi:hypothetical protein
MLPIKKPWDNVAMALILLGWQGHQFFLPTNYMTLPLEAMLLTKGSI